MKSLQYSTSVQGPIHPKRQNAKPCIINNVSNIPKYLLKVLFESAGYLERHNIFGLYTKTPGPPPMGWGLIPKCLCTFIHKLGRAKRIWYLSPMRAAKVQASLRIRAVSPEPSLLAHTSSESRETFRQKARSLAPLNGWACAVKICHDGMLEDTNSLDAAQLKVTLKHILKYH